MSVWPANLRQWEPQLDVLSYIRVEGDIVKVLLERDPVTRLPVLWRSVWDVTETFPCEGHRLWCARWEDWP